jgi:hypothetical protein
MSKAYSAEELRKIELSFAYELASSWIDSETLPSYAKNKEPLLDWHDLATADADLSDAMAYLESRRLIERHPEHPTWVRICDEDEPLPAVPTGLSGNNEPAFSQENEVKDGTITWTPAYSQKKPSPSAKPEEKDDAK